jgi:hypothetical protein
MQLHILPKLANLGRTFTTSIKFLNRPAIDHGRGVVGSLIDCWASNGAVLTELPDRIGIDPCPVDWA